jgi:uncharacterized protein YdaU (DUF1376 family)
VPEGAEGSGVAVDYLPHYPYFPRDLRVKTNHLSLIERGAFREILDEMWICYQETDCLLPDDDEYLASLCRLSVEEWLPIRRKLIESARPVLSRIQGADGAWFIVSDRLQAELDTAREKIEIARKAGVKSGKSRRRKTKRKRTDTNGRSTDVQPALNGTRTERERNANQSDTDTESDTEEEKREREILRAGRESRGGDVISEKHFLWLSDQVRKFRQRPGVRDLELADPEEYGREFREVTGISPERWEMYQDEFDGVTERRVS